MFREEGCRPKDVLEKQFTKRVDFAEKFINIGDRVLEIGCADGSTLNIFRKRGMQVFGIELSEKNVQICRKRGINVSKCSYESYNAGNNESYVVYGRESSANIFSGFDDINLRPPRLIRP